MYVDSNLYVIVTSRWGQYIIVLKYFCTIHSWPQFDKKIDIGTKVIYTLIVIVYIA